MTLGIGRTGHSGSAPSPFDALNGSRLAGPENSHPLHLVGPNELVRSGDGGPISGTITVNLPAVVGEGVTGTIEIQAREEVKARSAAFRLVGLRLDERRETETHDDGRGNATDIESWVECHGSLFATASFTEPVIPASLQAGETWQGTFSVPAPPLGPPTAHLGESIVAWAVDIRWDIPMASDHFVALALPVAQNPDLLRAGVGKQGGESLLDSVSVGDGTIDVVSELPASAGSNLVVRATWPSAPRGGAARLELHRRTNAPNGTEAIIASTSVDPESLAAGTGDIMLAIPPGTSPSFDGAGLEIDYIVRVLVDRRLLPDAAIERPVGIC
jgi:hypothetical protein